MTDYSIFFIIAVVATGVGALLFLLSLFGLGEHDLDFDADSGGADVGLHMRKVLIRRVSEFATKAAWTAGDARRTHGHRNSGQRSGC